MPSANARSLGLPLAPPPAVPTRLAAAIFRAKAVAHRARRTLHDFIVRIPRFDQVESAGFSIVLAESRSPLWSDARLAERRFQFGKVHNLRRALRGLDGIVVPAGETFSFWRQIGRPSRRRGFVTGRMLQQGCLVPSTGGGLCQLSNALYQAALASNCLIVERHAHSRRVPGSAAALGRDATVAWNYVDLRFRPREAMLIEARLTREELVVRFLGRGAPPAMLRTSEQTTPAALSPFAESCGTCERTECFRHERAGGDQVGRTAYVLDECWPEFRDYLRRSRNGGDVLAIPLDGSRWRVRRYAWDVGDFAKVVSAPLATVARSLASRRVAEGPARRAAELRGAERLARRLSRALTSDVTDVCVAQSLLPFLWREGHLGGRRFTVLLTRLPMHLLHARLDAAAAAHPDRPSLADFRAPDWMAAAERAALAHADRIVTPHVELADLFGAKTLRLEWDRPAVPPVARENAAPPCIAFPGPTIARAGAFELREVARELDLNVMPLGSELEGPAFWRGVRIHRPAREAGPHAWLDSVAAVVEPAIFAARPRHLLAALDAGVPVIATAGCGLAPQPGLTIVPYGDPDALADAIGKVVERY